MKLNKIHVIIVLEKERTHTSGSDLSASDSNQRHPQDLSPVFFDPLARRLVNKLRLQRSFFL